MLDLSKILYFLFTLDNKSYNSVVPPPCQFISQWTGVRGSLEEIEFGQSSHYQSSATAECPTSRPENIGGAFLAPCHRFAAQFLAEPFAKKQTLLNIFRDPQWTGNIGKTGMVYLLSLFCNKAQLTEIRRVSFMESLQIVFVSSVTVAIA